MEGTQTRYLQLAVRGFTLQTLIMRMLKDPPSVIILQCSVDGKHFPRFQISPACCVVDRRLNRKNV